MDRSSRGSKQWHVSPPDHNQLWFHIYLHLITELNILNICRPVTKCLYLFCEIYKLYSFTLNVKILFCFYLTDWHTVCCKRSGFTPGRLGVRVRRANRAGSQLCSPSFLTGCAVCYLLLCQPMGWLYWGREFGHGDPHSHSSSIHRYRNELLCRLNILSSC